MLFAWPSLALSAGQVHPEAGDRSPKQWQQGPDTSLFSLVSRCPQRHFLWGNSGVVCQAVILDVPAFKCKNHSWIPSLKHTLISDPGYRGREEKKVEVQSP